MAVGDAAVLWMGWEAEINTFVLIFAVLSVVLFIIGKIIFAVRKLPTKYKADTNVYGVSISVCRGGGRYHICYINTPLQWSTSCWMICAVKPE